MKRILTLLALLSLSLNVVAKPIAETQDLVSPLLPGQSIPSTMTSTIKNENVDLAELIRGKPTVLFFYRGGWCPFCNVQMGQLQEIEGDLKNLGFQLIGISTDSPTDLQKSINKKELSYQLLSDYNSNVSQAFGLAFYASQKVTDRYLAKMNLQNPLQKNAAGDERLVLPAPAVYVVDAKGLVQFQYVNPNYKTRLAPELLLHAAKLAM
ncbi:peroxiredoxin-like family protein [Thalassotalea psychrophila]|uniref:thioredoxin-dependent peroxiredoxin n=1 Tax=Thalassotalea psychrophila TaxID=3065647 RepID=A0ABY9TVC9_9GAMM|nr:peroxiredoxin-like family protein [Colwelliaceae bacterium SQ149]